MPVGTKITMLDFSLGTPEYYYHVIDQNDYNGVRDYNFEVEAESQAEAKKLLVEFAMKYNFEVEKGPGKSTRALLSIKKTQ